MSASGLVVFSWFKVQQDSPLVVLVVVGASDQHEVVQLKLFLAQYELAWFKPVHPPGIGHCRQRLLFNSFVKACEYVIIGTALSFVIAMCER